MNNSKNVPNNNQKFLNHKRKPQFSLEEILNIYCKQHDIEDNEISEKIKTIYYNNPEQNILIDYNKEKGDKFPLSRHIHKKEKEKIINFEEDEKEKEIVNEQKNEEKEKEKEEEEDTLFECFICGWKFLKEMSFEEKKGHINLCIEGKGEKNKKEIISTYKELENLRNNEERQNNNDNNDEGRNAHENNIENNDDNNHNND